MHSIAQIAKPSFSSSAPEVLDAGIVVGSRGRDASDADPVLGGGVLEGELGGLVVGEVGEFVGVGVSKEEEVRAGALGDGHGAGDGAQTAADGGQEADFHAVDCFVEVCDLGFLGGGVVPLLGDGGVGLGGDF